jgi:hypothetical protein
VARVRDARFREALSLAQLRGRRLRGHRVERVRQPEARSDAGRDRDREVDPRRYDPVDALRCGESVDGGLVLHGHDRATIREPEARRERVAVDGDDVEPALVRGLEQPELRRPRP